MALSIRDELRRTFELAAMRKEAESLRSPRQHEAHRRLRQRCEDARVREKDLYRERHEDRVAAARARLIDAAGRPARALRPAYAAHDRFSPAETLHRAQVAVRQAHEARIGRIDRFEHRALAELLERSRRENALQGQVRASFEAVADRRSRPETQVRRPSRD